MTLSRSGRRLEIADRDVHLWAIRFEASEDHFERCRQWLDPDERERAARFHFERHARAYILGRGVLRALIGAHLNVSPEAIRFRYGAKGKPALDLGPAALSFNFSNSGPFGLYALTQGCELGVDVEELHAVAQMVDVAARFFARDEISDLMSLPEPERPGAFFRCWTRKEAYVKAVGDGLSVPLDSFRVTLLAGEPARITHLDGSEESALGWTLHDVSPTPEHVGGLAYPDVERPLVVNPVMTASELLDDLPVIA
jgi:4'-phosphopantetheinyl transferase